MGKGHLEDFLSVSPSHQLLTAIFGYKSSSENFSVLRAEQSSLSPASLSHLEAPTDEF